MMENQQLLEKEELEEQMVNDAFQHLISSYLETKHRKKVDIITKAFNFAKHAHSGVRRLSGEPYIMHPLAVAQIVCTEIGLGSTSICCALLHDVVEDTDYTVEDISNMFGPKIAQIVDGLTKISGGIFGAHASAQAENFKKLLLTMSEDIRVILIKIADRLHNMRTLGSQPENKRYKIAGETLYIYAPLANRLGLNSIKSELENLSFRYEHPEEYAFIEQKLAASEAERNTIFDEFTAPIRTQLDQMGINYSIKARIKTPYSIWHKMQTKHVVFEDIYDILAVRIVFQSDEPEKELQNCFNIYAGITKLYASHPQRLRDWVSRPKANGYQALHTTLMSNRGEWIEVQIRSQRMDEIAEKGFAAHWKYKDGDDTDSDAIETDKETELNKWLVTIKEILDDPQPDAMDFLDTIKLNLYASEIFVFTPKGDMKTLPSGSTALDFAFTIHSFVGSHCMGAKVNHKLVPLSYKLNSGDQVEILTSKAFQVQSSWLNMVTTAKATTKILSSMRRVEKEARKKGEAMLTEFLQQGGVVKDSATLEKLCKFHGCEKSDDLYMKIGQGQFTLGPDDFSALKDKSRLGFRRFLSFGRKKEEKTVTNDEKAELSSLKFVDEQKTKIDTHQIITINDENVNVVYSLADCCKPIPGDKIMAFADENDHIIIHQLQCPEAQRLKSNSGNRILTAKWNMQNKNVFLVSISLRGLDKVGLLNSITEVISKLLNVNIRKLEIESNDGIFEAQIQLYVHNTDEVNVIIQNLKKISDVKSVVRV